MTETIIATANTNPVSGSEVKIVVNDMVCSIKIEKTNSQTPCQSFLRMQEFEMGKYYTD